MFTEITGRIIDRFQHKPDPHVDNYNHFIRATIDEYIENRKAVIVERYGHYNTRIRVLMNMEDMGFGGDISSLENRKPYVEKSDCYRLLPDGSIRHTPEDFFITNGRDW